MRRSLCLIFFAALAASAALAQAPPPSLSFPPGLVPLDHGWRTHAGDNPAWAQPDFDDSAWQPATLAPKTRIPAGTRWFRLRLNVSPNQSPIALLVAAPSNSFELWIDGQPVRGYSAASWLHMTAYGQFVVTLPSPRSSTLVALRVSVPRYLADTYTSSVHLSIYAGGLEATQDATSSARDHQVLAFLPSTLMNAALVVAGIGSLLLFFAQRSRREYLWLALYFIVLGSSTAVWEATDTGLAPYWANSLIADPVSYLTLLCQIEFSFAFIHRPVSRLWRAFECLLFAAMLMAYLAAAGLLPPAAYWILEAVASLGVGFGIPLLLLVQYRRGNREAGLLILPSLLPAAAVGVADIGTAASPFGLNLLTAFQTSTFFFGHVQVSFADLADLGFLLAIGALLLFRFTRVTRQQARAAAELEAAQRVQSLLLRRAHPEASSAHIQVVYRPAQEVGGDFFHTAQIGGLTRIVVGDVSGKGMGAAMLVSVLLGALDSIEDSDPAAVIGHLNAIMLTRQQGGFVTCLCAALAADGRLTLANAGHLAPYRNGEEIQVDNGLPLGITADASYSENTVRLAPNDQLTLLSDGVVEAQSATGELFGFDRTRAISTQSAEAIASAAQTYGQEDDITVLAVRYSGNPGSESASIRTGTIEVLKPDG